MFIGIFQDFLHFLWRLFWNLVMLALFGYAVWGFIEMSKGGDLISSLANFYFIYAAVGAGAILFAILHLGRVSSIIIDTLFGGKTYLSKAPRTYGALTGMISDGRLDEAERSIKSMMHDSVSRRDPRFARIVMEFYADVRHQPEMAWEFGLSFFGRWTYVRPEDSLHALLILDDLGAQLGVRKKARRILAWELHRLPKPDQALLQKRLTSE